MSLWEINRRLSGDVVLGALAFQTKVEIRIAQPLAVSPWRNRIYLLHIEAMRSLYSLKQSSACWEFVTER